MLIRSTYIHKSIHVFHSCGREVLRGCTSKYFPCSFRIVHCLFRMNGVFKDAIAISSFRLNIVALCPSVRF